MTENAVRYVPGSLPMTEKLEDAVRYVLALEPDLRTLLQDLKAEGTGRARCFLKALEDLRKDLKAEGTKERARCFLKALEELRKEFDAEP